MIEWDLTLASPLLGTVIGCLSPNADTVKIKLSAKEKSIQCLFYDKNLNLELIATFPGDPPKLQYFSLDLPRFKALINKRKALQFRLDDTTFEYEYPGLGKNKETRGKLQTKETNARFNFPRQLATTWNLTKVVFDYYNNVKLRAIFEKREMMLYLRYKGSTQTVHIASATNFHIALSVLTPYDLGQADFDLVLPFKYLDIAQKIAKFNNDEISLFVQDNNYTFHTPFAAFTLPVMAEESSKITVSGIIDHLSRLVANTTVKVEVNTAHFFSFLSNAVAVEEKDSSPDLVLSLLGPSLTLLIETTHGTLQTDLEVKNKNTQKHRLKISKSAFKDLLSRIQSDTMQLCFAPNNLLIQYSPFEGELLQLTTIEVS